MKIAAKACYCFVFFLTVSTALAQLHPNQERGFPNDKSHQSFGPDSINLLTGNVSIAIPIGPPYRVSSTLFYQLVLRYSGQVWDYRESCYPTCYVQAIPNRRSSAGLGWYLSLGRLIPPSDLTNETGAAALWVYESADGNDHVFYPNLHEEIPTAGIFYTRDGTYLRMRELSPGSPSTEREIDFPDGTIHKFDQNGYLLEMRDRSGNYVRHGYTWGFEGLVQWTITDGNSIEGDFRTQTIDYLIPAVCSCGDPISCAYSGQLPERVTLTAFNGQQSVWTFSYDQACIARGYGHNDPNVSSTARAFFLREVSLPLADGSLHRYQMPLADYNTTGDASGTLRALTLPTLGRVEWDYARLPFPDGSSTKTYRRHSIGVTARRMKDAAGTLLGTWSFQHQAGPACPIGSNYWRYKTNAVTDPAGHQNVHYFSTFSPGDSCANTEGWNTQEYGLAFTRTSSSGGRFLSAETKENGTVLVRSAYLSYERDASAGGGGYTERESQDSNRRASGTRMVYNDDGGRFADVALSNFDGLGHYRQSTTAGNFDSGNDRTDLVNFNPAAGTYPGSFVLPGSSSPWTLNTYDFQQSTEGAATAKVTFCFDTTTGFLKRQRTMKVLAPDPYDLLAVYTPNSNGEVIREEYFGGDSQALSTSTDLCNLSLPSNQYRIDHTYQYGALKTTQYYDLFGFPLSFKSADFDIDRNTGLVAVSRDTAGLATNYEYDKLGRTTWEKTETWHGAWTQYLHVTATSPTALAKVETKRLPNGGVGTLLEHTQLLLDSFGRTWKERRLMPNGTWSTRETGYNALGWTTFVSSMEASDLPVNRTIFSEFDPFGRARRIRPPDSDANGHHDTTYSYSGNRVVSHTAKVRTSGDANTITETPVTTTEIYDRQGRRWQVTEPSGPGGQNVTTQYSYDPGNRLKQAITTAPEATQTRTFNYDNRGLLISETIPEMGASGNGTTYFTYDARGNRTRKRDGAVNGPFDLTYVYDRAERLFLVKETSGREWKRFTYATANGSNDWKNGKLTSAIRYNYHTAWGGGTTTVTEYFYYGGKGGRTSRKTYVINGDTSMTFNQYFYWTDLGRLTEQTYPACVSPCPFTSGMSQAYAYTNGLLVQISGYASTITYHPNGLVNSVGFSNGVTWTQQNDPNHLERPNSIFDVRNNLRAGLELRRLSLRWVGKRSRHGNGLRPL